MNKDYYKIAQVHPQAETRVVERMRKVLARIYHPDNVIEPSKKEEFDKKMKEINEAFDVLTDETKRKEYDQKYYSVNKTEPNFDYGPTYKYKYQFEKSLYPYIDSDFLKGLSHRAKKEGKLDSSIRQGLWPIAISIEKNEELYPNQKEKLYAYIARAREEGLVD